MQQLTYCFVHRFAYFVEMGSCKVWNAADLCVLILYPVALLNSFICIFPHTLQCFHATWKRFLLSCLGGFHYLLFLMCLLRLYLCWIEVAKASHPLHVPDLGKTFLHWLWHTVSAWTVSLNFYFSCEILI